MGDYFTKTQEQFLAIAPVLPGILSVLCSSTIIFVVLRGRGKRLKRVYQRLIFMLASSDIIFSCSKLTSVIMVPSDSQVWGAIGTTATCSLQGTLKQIGMSAPYYNGALSLFYLMSVRYKMKEERFAARVEPFVHCVCILVPLLGAIFGLSYTAFNEVGMGVLGCYYADKPFGCSSSPNVDCVRGQHSPTLQFAFGFAPIVLLLVFIPLCQLLTYLSVREQSKRMSTVNTFSGRTSVSTSSGRTSGSYQETKRRSRQVANQALFYVGTFFIAWIPAGILRVWEFAGWMGSSLFVVAMISQIFFPMQGVFIFFVYISPRYKFFREYNRNSRITVGKNGDFVQPGRLASLYEAVTNERSIVFLRRSGEWKNRRSCGTTSIATIRGNNTVCNLPSNFKNDEDGDGESCSKSCCSQSIQGKVEDDRSSTVEVNESSMKQMMTNIMVSIDIDDETGVRESIASLSTDELHVEKERTSRVTFDDSIQTLGGDIIFQKETTKQGDMGP